MYRTESGQRFRAWRWADRGLIPDQVIRREGGGGVTVTGILRGKDGAVSCWIKSGGADLHVPGEWFLWGATMEDGSPCGVPVGEDPAAS